MSYQPWPSTWPVQLGELKLNLPLVKSDDGFQIYAFDPMGRGAWNIAAAQALARRLGPFTFDFFLCAESKSIALAEELARLQRQKDYVVLRKSRKLYMTDPLEMEVKSLTTEAPQRFYLGRDQQELLRGKRVCLLDDVISTTGTLNAMLEFARLLHCTVTVIACVLTEETRRDSFEGVPVVSLDHIPLPGLSEN